MQVHRKKITLLTFACLTMALAIGGCSTAREPVSMIDPSFSYLRNTNTQTIATSTPLTAGHQSARLPGSMQSLSNPTLSDEYEVFLPDTMEIDSAQTGLPLHDQLLRADSSSENFETN